MILITEFMDAAAVYGLSEHCPLIYDPTLADRQGDIPEMMENVRALVVRNRTLVTPGLLNAAPSLECVGRLGVGLDNIDVAACEERGVTVYPATGANSRSVAEYVINCAMSLLRGAYQEKHAMLSGQWPRQVCVGREIGGKRLGLVGFGGIAQETAQMAAALGMEILAFDPFLSAEHPAWQHASKMELDVLLAQADVISLHVPLTQETRHLIDEPMIRHMKPDAVLINTARGGVVDETALAEALSGGFLSGAALDVFETEPLSADAAKIFKGLPNVILTPHIAGVTDESNQRVSELIAERVIEHLRGSSS